MINRKTLPEMAAMAPDSRRRFLEKLAVAMAVPGVPLGLRYAVNDLLMGTAYAQTAEAKQPTYFIEISYRDQVDMGEVFVAPGLAGYANLIRGEGGRKCAMFYQQAELTQRPRNVFLTPESLVLDKHLDTIAFIDTCELTPGAIHYHNAANRNRAPDCNYTQGPGMLPMYSNDKVSNFPQGCEKYFSALPTPASMHNHWQKQVTPGLRNGVALKGISRSIHTVYHSGANLPGAELDRMQDQPTLFKAFPDKATAQALQIMPTPAEAELFSRILRRADPEFLKRRRFGQGVLDGHLSQVGEAQKLLHSDATTREITLPLTADEMAFWRSGVPEPTGDGYVPGQDGRPRTLKFQIWEQYAFAYKLMASGLTRSIALECEFIDIHNQRPRKQMNVHAKQLSLPLARLIENLKASNLYNNTLIAIYTADGSRAPAANSSGDEGKSTVILAGGMIRGGYYGNITIGGPDRDGHKYLYHAPDVMTGEPASTGVSDKTQRLAGRYLWRTVAKALRIPDSVVKPLPMVGDTQPLGWLLRV